VSGAGGIYNKYKPKDKKADAAPVDPNAAAAAQAGASFFLSTSMY